MIKKFETYINESSSEIESFIPFELREKFDQDLEEKMEGKDYRDIKLKNNNDYLIEIGIRLNGRKVTFTDYNYISNNGVMITMILKYPEFNSMGILCFRGRITKHGELSQTTGYTGWDNAYVVVDERKEVSYKENRIISKEDPYGEEDWEN